MNRKVSKMDIGPDEVRYRTTLESDDCIEKTPESVFFQFELLRMIGTDPSLTACGLSHFQSLKMWHNGERWIIEVEAVEKSNL